MGGARRILRRLAGWLTRRLARLAGDSEVRRALSSIEPCPDEGRESNRHQREPREPGKPTISVDGFGLSTAVTPRPFFEAARRAIEERDDEAALGVLQRCLRQFPESAPAHALVAHIHERRYLRDLLSVDGRQVVENLAAACRHDPTNRSHRSRLQRFLDLIGHPVGDPFASLSDGESRVPDPQRLDDSLALIEERGRLHGDHPEEIGRIRRERERLCSRLTEVRRTLQSRNAVVIDGRGEVWDETSLIAPDPFSDLARELLAAARIAARRTQLGAFRGALLESRDGALVLRRGTRSTVAVLLPRQVPAYGCQERLEQLIRSGERSQPRHLGPDREVRQ